MQKQKDTSKHLRYYRRKITFNSKFFKERKKWIDEKKSQEGLANKNLVKQTIERTSKRNLKFLWTRELIILCEPKKKPKNPKSFKTVSIALNHKKKNRTGNDSTTYEERENRSLQNETR